MSSSSADRRFVGPLVYSFGGGESDGRPGMKGLLGGKGANLAEIASIGLPMPLGFTLTPALCAVA